MFHVKRLERKREVFYMERSEEKERNKVFHVKRLERKREKWFI